MPDEKPVKEPDLTHPGLDRDAVSDEVDMGPALTEDHFAHGHDVHRLAGALYGPDVDEGEVT